MEVYFVDKINLWLFGAKELLVKNMKRHNRMAMYDVLGTKEQFLVPFMFSASLLYLRLNFQYNSLSTQS